MRKTGAGNRRYDVIMVADPRFGGGTSAALATDVRGFAALGARVGLVGVRSRYLRDGPKTWDAKITALFDEGLAERIEPGAQAGAQAIFFHHPMVFFSGIEQGAKLDADIAVLVAHHTPFRGDGSLQYNPMATLRAVRRDFGVQALFAPVSGVTRRQLASFAPLIRLSSQDWHNVFDTGSFLPNREIFSGGPVVIGRHGRSDTLKFPDRIEDIAASLPAGPDTRIRVMGCPEKELRAMGADLSGWEIVPFNGEPITDFLESLDVFSYFYSGLIIESFGRTVAEAALMGAVCVLDRRFEPSFGDVGIYCAPADVGDVVARLGGDVAQTRARAAAARDKIVRLYDVASLEARWHGLLNDRGVAARQNPSAAPATVLRKMFGLYRRQAAGQE